MSRTLRVTIRTLRVRWALIRYADLRQPPGRMVTVRGQMIWRRARRY